MAEASGFVQNNQKPAFFRSKLCAKQRKLFSQNPLTDRHIGAIILIEKGKEMITMKYIVETRIGCEVLDTYERAEIFCYEHGIHPEEIVEVTEEEAAEICG